MKIQCVLCGKTKPEESFYTIYAKGKEYRRKQCKTCFIQKKVENKHKVRNWFVELKKELKCKFCGVDDFRVLDFDHIGKKTQNVSDMVRRCNSKENILKEISRCQVLCSNCHRIKTYEENKT